MQNTVRSACRGEQRKHKQLGGRKVTWRGGGGALLVWLLRWRCCGSQAAAPNNNVTASGSGKKRLLFFPSPPFSSSSSAAFPFPFCSDLDGVSFQDLISSRVSIVFLNRHSPLSFTSHCPSRSVLFCFFFCLLYLSSKPHSPTPVCVFPGSFLSLSISFLSLARSLLPPLGSFPFLFSFFLFYFSLPLLLFSSPLPSFFFSHVGVGGYL